MSIGLFLAGAATFCHETMNIWKILGYVVMVIKIVIPLALIVLGMIDLGKAVISSDDKAISKSVGTLVKRFIAAVIVFFVPTIVNALFNIIGITTGAGDYLDCVKCVTNVSDANCPLGQVVGNMT